MMYGNKLAVALKANGKVLREQGNNVFLPFGSEYSIFLKNLNSVRAIVKIQVDGNEVTGGGLIVDGNSSVDLERYIGSNMSQGNRFKFIERSESVEQARGIGVEDGLIRIEYEFEQVKAPRVDYDNWHNQKPWSEPTWPKNPWTPTVYYGSSNQLGSATSVSLQSTTTIGSTSASSGILRNSCSTPTASYSANVEQNSAGISVPGSVSNQQFQYGYIGKLDGVKNVIVLQLLGAVGEQLVAKPVTVKAKPKCVTCHRVNKATAKFCTNCGTGLELIA